MDEPPQVILITGNRAAGKSTVAQLVAERLPRSVHLREDIFRRMIVRGQAAMGAELSDDAVRQLSLRHRLAAESARLYADAGFTVVYQDIVIGAALADVAGYFAGLSLAIVVFCPRLKVVAAREAGRPKTGYGSTEEILFFDRVLREETQRLGYWLDSSALTPDETAEQILAHVTPPTDSA